MIATLPRRSGVALGWILDLQDVMAMARSRDVHAERDLNGRPMPRARRGGHGHGPRVDPPSRRPHGRRPRRRRDGVMIRLRRAVRRRRSIGLAGIRRAPQSALYEAGTAAMVLGLIAAASAACGALIAGTVTLAIIVAGAAILLGALAGEALRLLALMRVE